MTLLVTAHKVSKFFSGKTLFKDITFSVGEGERIGLIGPNGAGKSTLLKLIAGLGEVDEGTLSRQKGLRVGYLEQVPHFDESKTTFETLMEGASDSMEWSEMSRAHEILSKLNLKEDDVVGQLSGGWKKRLALGRELMKEPAVLLLDEPTNHLDVDGIVWIENFLESVPFATVTITHDRVFLQNVSTRILELDRRNPNGLLDVRGTYSDYLETKAGLMSAQESQETKLKNTLRRETEWLRQGAKARTTKQSARIERAGELQNQVEELEERNQVRSVRIDFQDTGSAPKKLIEALGVSKTLGGRLVVPHIENVLVTPKSRIGLLGPNGCGKSTFLKLLLKQLNPDSGQVNHADALKVAYFEQNRGSLDPKKSVLKTICPMGDHVDFGAGKVHVGGFLKRFLFGPEMHDQPVEKLSGGEQARLLIAKLMLQPANVLVLDEPTNDLDIATLNVLQEVLQDFNGAVLLVSHDRFFLDQVSKEILAFSQNSKGEPELQRFTGVQQWQRWYLSKSVAAPVATKGASPQKNPQAPAANALNKTKKQSFTEQHELKGMEAKILAAEARVSELANQCSEPTVMADAKKLFELSNRLATAQQELESLYTRWAELEAKNT